MQEKCKNEKIKKWKDDEHEEYQDRPEDYRSSSNRHRLRSRSERSSQLHVTSTSLNNHNLQTINIINHLKQKRLC